MSCKNPLDPPANYGTRASQTTVIEGLHNSNLGIAARTGSEMQGVRTDDNYSLQMLLARIFAPDGQLAANSTDKAASLNALAGSEEISRALPNSVLLPLAWNELVARVSGALHHSSAVANSRVATFGDIQVDLYEMTVSRFGKSVVLTTQEFKTLRFLLLNPRRVISRSELLNQAWGYENYPSTRTVDNHIMKLRQKLEADPSRPMHFQTVHGTGYKFVP